MKQGCYRNQININKKIFLKNNMKKNKIKHYIFYKYFFY